MLCERCQKQEATIDVTDVVGGRVHTLRFCRKCSLDFLPPENAESVKREIQSIEFLKPLVEKDVRYALDGYLFVRSAIEFAQIDKSPDSKHVSGRELIDLMRKLALDRFGAEAKAVLNSWGINRTEDFGEIIFNMVEKGLLAAHPGDSKKDFENGYNFDQVFPET